MTKPCSRLLQGFMSFNIALMSFVIQLVILSSITPIGHDIIKAKVISRKEEKTMYLLLLIIIYISFISLGLPDSMLGSTWPTVYEDINVPISYAGVISMIISFGTIVSSLFSDKLIKKLGTGLIMITSVFLTAIALFGFSVSNSFLLMCIMSIPLGLGGGSVDAALNNYIALHYKARHMNWLHCFWGLGASIGPVVVSYWLVSGNWKMGYRIISIIQFTLVAILVFSIPLWKKVASKDKLNKEVRVKAEKITIKRLIALPGAKAALFSFFCYCSIEATTGLWGSSYLVITKNINADTAARWISIFYFGITLGRFLSGFITIKLNQKQMVRLGIVILAIGIALLFIPAKAVLLLPGLFMIGLGCAPIFPSLLHETPENFGSQYSQSIMGVQMASAYIGSTFIPPVFGYLARHVGYDLFPYFISVILIVMLVMVEKLHKRVNQEKILRASDCPTE